ncbi:MAG: heme exporter protein CcmD [Burkholderiaceae bacterium]
MNWNSIGEFTAMGGYGLYVWGSFLMVALVAAAEVTQLRLRARALDKLAFAAGEQA